MVARRWRSLWLTGAALLVLWVAAVASYRSIQASRMTAERVQQYVSATDLSKLSGKDREKALRELARRINLLPFEERRKARLERSALRWFEQMTEEEKSWFVEETMPSGFKQMLSSFEQMPEEKRKRAVDDAVRNLRQSMARAAVEGDTGFGSNIDTNRPPISPELEAKIRTIGLKTFYTQSSAQTKAELAPLLEEIQRGMESGRMLRRR